MLSRVIERAGYDQRVDDNHGTFIKRMDGFLQNTVPVASHYEAQGNLMKVVNKTTRALLLTFPLPLLTCYLYTQGQQCRYNRGDICQTASTPQGEWVAVSHRRLARPFSPWEVQ